MSRKKLVTSSDSAQNKGQQLKLPSLEDDQLVPMATKTIGMGIFAHTVFIEPSLQ